MSIPKVKPKYRHIFRRVTYSPLCVAKHNGDLIELDAETNSITIQATTSIVIKAEGAITLDAAQVNINGRAVRPSASPI